MKINEVETGSLKQRLDEVFPLLLLVPAVKAAAAALTGKAVAAGAAIKGAGALATTKAAIAGAGKTAATNIARMGAQAGTKTATKALGKQMTSGTKLMKGVKRVGNKLNQAPACADSEAGKFVKDLVSNPTGGPVDAPAGTAVPAPTAPATPAPQVAQPAQGVSPEASAAIANVQAQQGGRAGIAQRRRQAAKAKA